MGSMLTRAEAARYLGISTVSVGNWIRHGYLVNHHGCFAEDDLARLKDRIESGEIRRLNTRANKRNSGRRFIPDEYLSSKETAPRIREIVWFISEKGIDPDQALFVLAVNLFIASGDISRQVDSRSISFLRENFRRIGVREHILKWRDRVLSGGPDPDGETVRYLAGIDLPGEEDILGIIYQSLLHEGRKSDRGSYYTPAAVVSGLIDDCIRPEFTVLDPCCGTGQFLLRFAERVDDPARVYGFDIDRTAADIAAVNLLLAYNDTDFTPNIHSLNALTLNRTDMFSGSSDLFGKFDLIATNPPWGAKYGDGELAVLQSNFPDAESGESFSFFIRQAYRFLKPGGVMGFVLPESITNVRNHKDIRSFILPRLTIRKIIRLGKIFKNVFSPAVAMVMEKGTRSVSPVRIVSGGEEYHASQERFRVNRNHVFDILVRDIDIAIFKKLTEREHVTLENNADWALGIVTGDNKKFVKSERDGKEWEPVYRGSDVEPFFLKEAKSWIRFQPEFFQQAAPECMYRVEQKLVYKFISDRLVFAYDDRQSLTLNSANILIPRIGDYPVKALLSFLNSDLFSYYYRKKFSSLKILRGDLEQLPLPLLSESEKRETTAIADAVLQRREGPDRLNAYVFALYGLTDAEIGHVLKSLPGRRKSSGSKKT